MSTLQRSFYHDKIASYLWKPIIKVLTGMRRVGKTTLLQQLAVHHKHSYLVAMDDLSIPRYSAQELHDHLMKQVNVWYTLLLIDEIQTIPEREKAINSLHRNVWDHVDIVITWSTSMLLSSELSTLLAGRYIEIHVTPFSFDEYCIWKQIKQDRPWFLQYIQDGWIPALYIFSEQAEKKQRAKSIVDTIVYKDIVQKHDIRDPSLLQQLIHYLTDNIWSITNIANIAKELSKQNRSVHPATLSNYVTYICETFYIYHTPLYDIQWKKVFDRWVKYYLADPIFRTLMMSWFEGGIGKSLENIIAMHARRYGRSIYTWRNWSLEVDFILERLGQKKYIQVAYLTSNEEVANREYRSLEKISDAWPKYYITLDEFPLQPYNGIIHIPAWEMASILA